MSTEQNTVVVLAESDLSVLGNMEIKNEDVVAVAVARRERSLETRLNEADKTFNKTQAEIEKNRKSFEKALSQVVEKDLAVRVEAVKAAFSALGATVRVRLYPAYCPPVTDDQKAVISVSLNIEQGQTCHKSSFEVSKVEVQSSEDVERLYEEGTRLEGVLRNALNERIEYKKALGNLGTTERRARAALAEISLNSSPKGRALLAAMTEIPDLLAVPALDMLEVKE